MTFGERIKTARRHARLSQTQVGKVVGVHQQQVSDWEHDKMVPAEHHHAGLAKALGVTLADLRGWLNDHQELELEETRAQLAASEARGAQLEKVVRDLVAELRLLTIATRELHDELRQPRP